MLILFFAYLMTFSANAQVRFTPVAGQYEAKGEFQYLNTSANYPSDGGSSSNLYGGGKLTRMLGVGEVSYDLSPAIRFWGGFSGGQTTADVVNSSQSVSSPVTNTHTLSGMSEGWVGAQWWIPFQKLHVVPQVDFVYPFTRVNQISPDPLLSDGAMQFTGGSWFMIPLNDLTPFGYVGATYRDEGRSALIPYSVGLRYGRNEGWWLQAEFRGFQSITDDTNSGNRNVRDGYLSLVDGGSYEFFAINPSRSEVSAMTGVHVNHFGIYGGVSKSVFGRGSADDFVIRVGLTFTGALFARAGRAPKPSEGFAPKPEKYDDAIFQNDLVPEPYTEEPVVVVPPPRKKASAKTKSKSRRAAPAAPMPNVEMLMKDTQKTLENKKGR